MIEEGKVCPAFKALSTDGPVSKASMKGAPFILYFYPKDDTPGCTTESCSFRDNFSSFKKLKIKVLGVSKDTIASHEKFIKKYDLPFPLISDEDGTLCERFGTWVEKSMYGKKYMGIERSTFLIDKSGDVEKIWRKVKPKDHIMEIIQYLNDR